MASLFLFYHNMQIDDCVKEIEAILNRMAILYKDHKRNEGEITKLTLRMEELKKRIEISELEIKDYHNKEDFGSGGARTSGPML